MRILGLDTSLTGTGMALIDLATWPPSNPPRAEGELVSYEAQAVTVRAPKPGKDKSKRAMVRRVNALIEQIEWVFKDDKPEHVAMEALAYGARGEGVWVLPWIFGRALELCETYDVPVQVVSTSGRAKFAAGKGNAHKETVMMAAHKLSPEAGITNNNEADALTVGATVCQQIGLPIWPVTNYRNEVIAGLGD